MAWTALIAPDWPQLQAIIERDVVHRAGQLTRVGWAGAVTGLHRTVVWHNATVEIRERPNDQVRLDGRGLLFVPSVFIYPGLGIYLDPRGDQRWSTPPGAAPRSGRPSRAHPDHCAGCWEPQGLICWSFLTPPPRPANWWQRPACLWAPLAATSASCSTPDCSAVHARDERCSTNEPR